MGNNTPATENKNHLFQVEILLENSSHALAIAALMQVLNHEKVKDFRITGGMELGKIIEAALQAAPTSNAAPAASKGKGPTAKQPTPIVNTQIPAQAPNPVSAHPPATAPTPASTPAPAPAPTKATKVYTDADKDKLQSELLEEYRQSGTLIRLTVVKAKGVKLSMPCRILNFDASNSQLTIYHVDEKRVYSFKLNEIEDMVAHKV